MSHPTHNRGLIILILGALSTISPFAIDMYLPAFPGIAAALHTSTAKISLSISSYFVGIAAGQLFYGPLLDRFGRKLPLYAGLALFIVASLLCTISSSVGWLISMRFLQALGGCAAQVAAMAMVRDFFPVQETAKIISLLILILGVSPLLAPSVGGYVALHLGWPWVFILLGLFALMMIIVCAVWLPEGHLPDPTVSLRVNPNSLRMPWPVLSPSRGCSSMSPDRPSSSWRYSTSARKRSEPFLRDYRSASSAATKSTFCCSANSPASRFFVALSLSNAPPPCSS